MTKTLAAPVPFLLTCYGVLGALEYALENGHSMAELRQTILDANLGVPDSNNDAVHTSVSLLVTGLSTALLDAGIELPNI